MDHRFRIEKSPLVVLILRLLIALVLLTSSKLMLYLFNHSLFPGITVNEFLQILYHGMRFDISALLYSNLLFILLLIIPSPLLANRTYLRITDWVYCISNIIALIPNFADAAYYPFSLKRLTSDIFRYIALGDDTAHMMPQFIHDYWYIFILWILFILILVYTARIIRVRINPSRFSFMKSMWQIPVILLIAGVCLLGMRGGFQLKPISPITASYLVGPQNSLLALNSTFTLMQTLGKQGVEKKSYFINNEQLNRYFSAEKNIRKPYGSSVQGFKKLNIVIIILESISKEHIGFLNRDLDHGNYKGYTPFLDSLFSHSLVFRGFANGKRSIEAIPGILSGLPALMNEDFITSIYSNNKINSLASVLKVEGYHSAFFHGARNGSMGFDAFAKSVGVDWYYGRTEYDNDADYDGKWGIWDQGMLQFSARTINRLPQPFISVIFTLSSHHPYQVPAKYEGKFREGPLKIQKSISYADYSLKCFFDSIQRMPWYGNTLFVLSADHASEAFLPYYKTRVGNYEIPIAFYKPDGSLSGLSPKIIQQTDIMPSVLDYLGYTKPYIAFGNSVFDTIAPRLAVSYLSGTYQLVMGNFVLIHDGSQSIALYDQSTDKMQKHNCLIQNKAKAYEMEQYLKSIIQQFNNRLINNELTAKQPD